jgi:hypothetical protein
MIIWLKNSNFGFYSGLIIKNSYFSQFTTSYLSFEMRFIQFNCSNKWLLIKYVKTNYVQFLSKQLFKITIVWSNGKGKTYILVFKVANLKPNPANKFGGD